MITYGHEKYIKQAIEGVLMQECNFAIELIVADDCSPDRTERMVNQIIHNHINGKWIKYTKHAQNKGMNANFIWAAERCKGKYIALCEGDDYWTDPNKLQKQVDFLELNPSFSVSFHSVYKNYEDCYNIEIFPPLDLIKGGEFERKDLLNNNYIPTCSVLFRNQVTEDLDYLVKRKVVLIDWVVFLTASKYGRVHFHSEVMGVYRYGKGVFASLDQFEKLSLQLLVRESYLVVCDTTEKSIIEKVCFGLAIRCFYESTGVQDHNIKVKYLVKALKYVNIIELSELKILVFAIYNLSKSLLTLKLSTNNANH